MAHNCPGCHKAFLTARTLEGHLERAPLCSIDAPGNLFGCELVDTMLAELRPAHIVTMLRHPEDTICSDLINLVFFNLDHPENSTIATHEGTTYVYSSKLKDGRGAKWRPLTEPSMILRVAARHFAKVVDHVRASGDSLGLGALEVALACEYVRAIDAWTNVVISQYCPYVSSVEDGKILLGRMTAAVARTVQSNLVLDRVDWVRTVPYADENLL